MFYVGDSWDYMYGPVERVRPEWNRLLKEWRWWKTYGWFDGIQTMELQDGNGRMIARHHFNTKYESYV